MQRTVRCFVILLMFCLCACAKSTPPPVVEPVVLPPLVQFMVSNIGGASTELKTPRLAVWCG